MSFFNTYFHYTAGTEPPVIFHRWTAVGIIAALLGRQFWLPFGRFRIFPNHYIMLVGTPGSRKSTSIKEGVKVLKLQGYPITNLSATKTRKEKFLLDLEGEEEKDDKVKGSDLVMSNLGLDDGDLQTVREVFIPADEFNEFVPPGDLEFLSLLGTLWDWDDEKTPFTFRLKNSKSVSIYQPTINLLSGNTHEGLQQTLPPETIGQGFLSRLIFVYGEPSGNKVTFPKDAPESVTTNLLATLARIKNKVKGQAKIDDAASRALDLIYRTWPELADQRFKHYSTRRFTHLLKLCLICAASNERTTIVVQDVVMANSILSFAEARMPKALGEFGKSRHSNASQKVMAALYDTKKPLSLVELWKVVQNDLDKMSELSALIANLQTADKVQFISGKGGGFLPKQKPLDSKLLYVDYKLLKENV